jgi:3-hydroxybutyryl-CoA dehydrogenase
MKILVIGKPAHWEECQKKFGQDHFYSFRETHEEAKNGLLTNDVVFDFTIDEVPQLFTIYALLEIIVFLNASKISLQQLTSMAGNKINCTLFGFNGLPTLFNRSVLEVSLWRNKNADKLKHVCENLVTDYLVVDDRVGLVTGRVVSMIINEAYYTVQEGTATREDIDTAMKLGTNYPYGPFEWCQRIGIKHVYELLDALHEDTKDERYKICPLLKKEYLAQVNV